MRLMFRLQETLKSARAADQRQLERLRLVQAGSEPRPVDRVAYSGGVDSTLVAAIAHEQQGERATGDDGRFSRAGSPPAAGGQNAGWAWIGIHHQECRTRELDDPTWYSRCQPDDRCYACKQELHAHLQVRVIAAAEGGLVVDGVNLRRSW